MRFELVVFVVMGEEQDWDREEDQEGEYEKD